MNTLLADPAKPGAYKCCTKVMTDKNNNSWSWKLWRNLDNYQTGGCHQEKLHFYNLFYNILPWCEELGCYMVYTNETFRRIRLNEEDKNIYSFVVTFLLPHCE